MLGVRTVDVVVMLSAPLTPFGERTFLAPGDEAVVIVYDAAVHAPAQVREAVRAGAEDELGAASVLRQVVVAAGAAG